MPTLTEKIEFAETHVSNKEGAKFSTDGRDWIREEFWRPADGFKLWPRFHPETFDLDPKHNVCSPCGDHIGEIIEHPDDNPTATCRRKGCRGLTVNPVLVTILNLHRQDGKTFSTSAYAQSHMFKGRNRSFALMAASEDQARVLYTENYKVPIERNPKLDKRAELLGTSWSVPKLKNQFEALPASPRSVTGRTRTHLLIDEAKDILGQVAWEVMPAIQNMWGVECPRGHVFRLHAELTKREQCTACGSRLVPWFARIIITSSSGEIKEGSDYDWLNQLIEKLEKKPHPNVHLFRSPDPLNPSKSKKISAGLVNIFGDLDAMRHHVEAGMANKWTRKGVPFVSDTEIRKCEDPRLTNLDECHRPAVGFLDTSITADKTALVVLADDDGEEPWERVAQVRLDYWIPEEQPGGIISDREVSAHLESIIPMYPNLECLYVDTRGMKWAIEMVRDLRDRHLWGSKVRSWNKHGDEEQIGWELLLDRIMAQPAPTIRLQADEHQRREFRGVELKPLARRTSDRHMVVDRDRRKSHKDITVALAIAAYLAGRQSSRNKRAPARSGGRDPGRIRARGAPIVQASNWGPDSF